ncbi:MAG: flagellar hook assembly protein FlgD [Gammaproteobacteria bacterium]|nr:flagellar hook assembly protein FlgD [Gammaproteobacteria bacterium]MBL6998432.1 flagellar hook assembly protein FlgD [Gammaproteobacteria bacterium]
MAEIDNKQIYANLGLNKTQSSEAKANDELGQSEFLELMTAQLRFQDPLEPMENGDFLGQMAQFGTVSGINDLNSAFGSMSAAFQSNQALQASTMVGREVLVPGNQASLGAQGDLRMALDLDQPASKVVLSITDASGQLVQRMDLGLQQAGLLNVNWNGLNSDGNRVNPGRYKVSAEVHQGDQVSAGKMLMTVQVESVTLGKAGQDLTLTVSDLGDINMSQIRKIM